MDHGDILKIMLILLAAVIIAIPPTLYVALDPEEEDRGEELVVETIPPTSTIHSPLVYLAPPPDDLLEPVVITLRWGGFDLPRGGEIAHYDIQYRYSYIQGSYIQELGYPYFTDWIDLYTDTANTTADFKVNGGIAYEFRIRAEDKYGNVEDWPIQENTRTFVYSLPGIVLKIVRTVQPFIEEAVENVRDRLPEGTPPYSRVLTLQPVFFPEMSNPRILDAEDIIVHPSLSPYMTAHDISHMLSWEYPATSVKWEGRDPKGGVLTFDVQYRIIFTDEELTILNDITETDIPTRSDLEWIDWQLDTTETSAEFTFTGPGLYQFRCRAWNDLGVVELYPISPDASTYVFPAPGEHMPDHYR